jgi:hypothetical protein
MSNGKLNIVVSGGNANFGNVSQGDANTNVVESQKIDARAEQAFAEFFQELERRRASEPTTTRQLDALKEEVSALKTALQQGQTTKKKSLSETAMALYEQYGWAGDLLKKLLGLVIPGWLS